MRKRLRSGWVVLLLVCGWAAASAEKVSDLPAPTGYVNDFAGVLSPAVEQRLDRLCLQVDHQAHAQIAVVTVKTIDDDQSIEEFATELEDKWKVGTKGTDRGVLMILEMQPRHGRIEVGYGLEGILNDAKVGDIGRSMVPDAARGDYNAAVTLGVTQIANIIAKDAGVQLTPTGSGSLEPQGQPRQQQDSGGFGQALVYGAIGIFILFVLFRGGGRGLLWFLLGNFMGGGFGGRGPRGGGGFGGGGFGGGGDGGGGFGGFGGGSSGGGGASGDF